MVPLRSFLRHLGHDARDWELGVNEGRPERDAPRLAAQVERLASAAGRPVALIGWSLGGTVAREAARQAAAVTTQVITYGTPVVGGPTHTIGARSYGPQESARISALLEEHHAASPISVPITAIFTRRDGIVSWRACIDRASPEVRHVEVSSTLSGRAPYLRSAVLRRKDRTAETVSDVTGSGRVSISVRYGSWPLRRRGR
jgi:pimeloyl-ACP methyl ester carboxylesterase